MKTTFLIVLSFIISQGIFAQTGGNTPSLPVQSTEYYQKSNIYQQDFLYYCDILAESHPNPFINFPEEKFKEQKKVVYDKLANCKSTDEFLNILSEFIMPVRDAHTNVKNTRFNSDKVYPVRGRFFGDSLYILVTTNQLKNLLGKIITKINGIETADIVKKAFLSIPAENIVALKIALNQYLFSPVLLKYIGVIKDENDSLIINTADNNSLVLYPGKNKDWYADLKDHPITIRNPFPFTYQIIKDKNLCYFQFNQMLDKERAEMIARLGGKVPKGFNENFDDFLNRMIGEMDSLKIGSLLVDLRNNSGGSMILGDMLLYALGIDKYKGYNTDIKKSALYKLQFSQVDPDGTALTGKDSLDKEGYHILNYTDKIHKRFNGKVYFAISEWTFSSAVMLASIVKDNKLFKVIGEETRQRPSHFGEVLLLKLPNTSSVCTLSSKQFHRPDKSRDNEDTLHPDVPLYRTYSSITSEADPVYDWVIAQ